MTKKVIIFIAIFLASMFVSWKWQEHYFLSRYKHFSSQVDTLVIHDTTIAYKPILQEVVKKEYVCLPADTITIHDTLMVVLEREQIMWQDSSAIIYASGVMPSVDSVFHFNTTKIITKVVNVPTKVHQPWGIGIQAGYGVGVANRQVVGVPYIGVGISYNLLSW